MSEAAFSRGHAVQLAILRRASEWYFGVDRVGIEQLPEGPFLLAAAHHSLIDGPLILAHLGVVAAPMAARGLLRPPLNALTASWRPVAVERRRAGGDLLALRAALDALRHYPVLLFPEGGRRQGGTPSAHPGVGWLALRSGVRVHPAVLAGSERALPRGGWRPRRLRLTLRVGPAVDLSAVARVGRASLAAKAATAAIMAAIVHLEGVNAPSPGAAR